MKESKKPNVAIANIYLDEKMILHDIESAQYVLNFYNKFLAENGRIDENGDLLIDYEEIKMRKDRNEMKTTKGTGKVKENGQVAEQKTKTTRGRKPKTVVEEEKPKATRGRKPKTVVEEEKPKATRGRKPKTVVEEEKPKVTRGRKPKTVVEEEKPKTTTGRKPKTVVEKTGDER